MSDRLTIPVEAVGVELYDAIHNGQIAYIVDPSEGGAERAVVFPNVAGSMFSDWLGAKSRAEQEREGLLGRLVALLAAVKRGEVCDHHVRGAEAVIARAEGREAPDA